MLMTLSVVYTTELFISVCLLLFLPYCLFRCLLHRVYVCSEKGNKKIIRILRMNAMEMDGMGRTRLWHAQNGMNVSKFGTVRFAFVRTTHTVVEICVLLSVYVGTHACTHSYSHSFDSNEQRTAAIEIAYLAVQRTLCGAKCLCIQILLWFHVRLLAADAEEKVMPFGAYAIQFFR